MCVYVLHSLQILLHFPNRRILAIFLPMLLTWHMRSLSLWTPRTSSPRPGSAITSPLKRCSKLSRPSATHNFCRDTSHKTTFLLSFHLTIRCTRCCLTTLGVSEIPQRANENCLREEPTMRMMGTCFLAHPQAYYPKKPIIW